MRTLGLFVASVYLASSHGALAEDLWSTSSSVNGATVYSDASTLTCTQDQCSIWETTRIVSPLPDGTSAVRAFVVYDCAGQRTRTELEVRYAADQTVLGTTKATDEVWLPAREGTVSGDTLAFACVYLSLDSADLKSGVLDIVGRDDIRQSKATLPPSPALIAPKTERHSGQIAPVVLQIGAAATESEAEKLLVVMRQNYPGNLTGLEPRVERASVNGAPVFRALIRGFATIQGARALCTTIKARGADCFIRALPSTRG